MAPDLNSLPPSSPSLRAMPSTTATSVPPGDSAIRGDSPSPSPRSASISLQAAATMNAGLQREPSRRTSSSSLSRHRQSPQAGRRRSTVLMNLQLNDPSLPAPGEMVADGAPNHHRVLTPQSLSASPLLMGGDPRRDRAPSLGELHQELEAEQEAQVNRLLQMIRSQQLQLQHLQAAQGQAQSGEGSPTATTTQQVAAPPSLPTPSSSLPRSPSMSQPRSSFDIARDTLHRRSRTPSHGAPSPRFRSTSFGQEGEPHLSGVRDETTYYQAETQSLIRENQMLRHRIRELERQLSEAHASASVTREPVNPSHLVQSSSTSDDDVISSSMATPIETKDE